MSPVPALFLDRDGVINVDRGYVHKKEDFEFIEGIFDLCKAAKKWGYLLFVITNQAGIARGYYSEEDFLELTNWMCAVFEEKGIKIDKVYYCPYHPEHGIGRYKVDSFYRKPGPGMILEAAREFGVDLAKSVLIGDKESDIQAGLAAGVGCNLLYCPGGKYGLANTPASFVIAHLQEAVFFLARNAVKINSEQ